jgi:hypothetical protein
MEGKSSLLNRICGYVRAPQQVETGFLRPCGPICVCARWVETDVESDDLLFTAI